MLKLVCFIMANLQKRDLLSFLQDLPAAILAKLYQHSAACLAVFRWVETEPDTAKQMLSLLVPRELPDLSKQYIMRMLFLEQPLSITILNSWPSGTPRSLVWVWLSTVGVVNYKGCG